jgi:hypothetical protein
VLLYTWDLSTTSLTETKLHDPLKFSGSFHTTSNSQSRHGLDTLVPHHCFQIIAPLSFLKFSSAVPLRPSDLLWPLSLLDLPEKMLVKLPCAWGSLGGLCNYRYCLSRGVRQRFPISHKLPGHMGATSRPPIPPAERSIHSFMNLSQWSQGNWITCITLLYIDTAPVIILCYFNMCKINSSKTYSLACFTFNSFVSVLEIEPRVSCLLGKWSKTWVTLPALLFQFWLFERELHYLCESWPQTQDPPASAP